MIDYDSFLHCHLRDIFRGSERVNTIVGMLIDNGLNWEPHIKQLSLQLSKFWAIIFCLHNFVDIETLKLLYYSLIYSGVQYVIIS